MKLFSILGLFIVFLSLPAAARIFNVGTDDFAVYVKGSLDPVSYSNSLVSDSKGSNVTLDATAGNKISGEFGIFYATSILNFRLGLEYLRPHDLENAEGKSTTDEANLYSVKSEISILIPKATLEFNIKRWAESRFFISGSYGYAMLSARNSYSFTDAGKTQLAITDFDEQLSGTSFLIEGSLGYENLLADTTTFVIEAGYRSLIFKSLDYSKETVNFQGSQAKGQPAKNTDGSVRGLNLNGLVASFSFRFWL